MENKPYTESDDSRIAMKSESFRSVWLIKLTEQQLDYLFCLKKLIMIRASIQLTEIERLINTVIFLFIF